MITTAYKVFLNYFDRRVKIVNTPLIIAINSSAYFISYIFINDILFIRIFLNFWPNKNSFRIVHFIIMIRYNLFIIIFIEVYITFKYNDNPYIYHLLFPYSWLVNDFQIPYLFNRLQILFQEIRQEEPDVLVSREQELPHRPASQKPVPVLQTQEMSQNGHEERRWVDILMINFF